MRLRRALLDARDDRPGQSRIHRMGQQAAAVNLYYLLATSSKFAGDDDRLPDGAMFGALVKKAQVASRVVDPHAAASSLADAQVVTPRPRAARREEADDDDAGGADGEMPTPPRAERRADAADPPARRAQPRTSEEARAAASPWRRPPPLRTVRICSVGSRTRKTTRMAREEASRLAAEAERGARRAAHAAEAEARLGGAGGGVRRPRRPCPRRRSWHVRDEAGARCGGRRHDGLHRAVRRREAVQVESGGAVPDLRLRPAVPPRRRVRHIRNCSGVRV